MPSFMYVHALAALFGSAAGLLASVISNWIALRRNHRFRNRTRARSDRHELYRRFILEASKLYADSLVSDRSEVSNLVNIYALIAQMRVVSSNEVVLQAEKAGRLILDTYMSPNREFNELPMVMNEIDPLRGFSEACRRDLQDTGG